MNNNYGGMYVSQELKIKLNKIEKKFKKIIKQKEFKKELNYYYKNYIGRTSPLYLANNLTKHVGGAKIYFKREDLNHTGSHKINNALGQILLANKMGYTHIIAETGAGQHGVAVATVCALFQMKCTIFMGIRDIEKQKVNVDKMKLLGAEIKPVSLGDGTLKYAVDEAFEYFQNHNECYYLIGSAVGPTPYPEIVRYFQKIIGKETKKQILEVEHKLPIAVVACVGGGSNSIGIFNEFINDKTVKLYGIEAGGKGVETGKHSSAFTVNKVGIIHGMKTYVMQDNKGNMIDAYSISSGLDYPAVSPLHAYLKDIKRVEYDTINDNEALEAFFLTTRLEGIIPALESSHAISYSLKLAKKLSHEDIIIVCLSGRGDKDIETILKESVL